MQNITFLFWPFADYVMLMSEKIPGSPCLHDSSAEAPGSEATRVVGVYGMRVEDMVLKLVLINAW